jgi:hypothetical protein
MLVRTDRTRAALTHPRHPEKTSERLVDLRICGLSGSGFRHHYNVQGCRAALATRQILELPGLAKQRSYRFPCPAPRPVPHDSLAHIGRRPNGHPYRRPGPPACGKPHGEQLVFEPPARPRYPAKVGRPAKSSNASPRTCSPAVWRACLDQPIRHRFAHQEWPALRLAGCGLEPSGHCPLQRLPPSPPLGQCFFPRSTAESFPQSCMSDGHAAPPLHLPSLQNVSAAGRAHAAAKTVGPLPSQDFGLISALHRRCQAVIIAVTLGRFKARETRGRGCRWETPVLY